VETRERDIPKPLVTAATTEMWFVTPVANHEEARFPWYSSLKDGEGVY
jgi:hypothetical protein